MATAAPMDAIALLKADHARVAGLFEAFEAETSDGCKRAIADLICMALTIHTLIEEDIFYPACKGAVEDDLLEEAYVAHAGAKVLIAEIGAGGPDGVFFDAKVKMLSELIEHHVGEEEKRAECIFAQARKASLDMDALGRRMTKEMARLTAAYTRDGPSTPHATSFLVTELG
ncbi:hemerythrin domain-containing protein [soil metagenome]